MFRDLSASYYQKNKGNFKERLVKSMKIFPKNKKQKAIIRSQVI